MSTIPPMLKPNPTRPRTLQCGLKLTPFVCSTSHVDINIMLTIIRRAPDGSHGLQKAGFKLLTVHLLPMKIRRHLLDQAMFPLN